MAQWHLRILMLLEDVAHLLDVGIGVSDFSISLSGALPMKIPKIEYARGKPAEQTWSIAVGWINCYYILVYEPLSYLAYQCTSQSKSSSPKEGNKWHGKCQPRSIAFHVNTFLNLKQFNVIKTKAALYIYYNEEKGNVYLRVM